MLGRVLFQIVAAVAFAGDAAAAMAPIGEEIVLGRATHAWWNPDSLVWTGSRFAMVYEAGEPKAAMLRFAHAGDAAIGDPIELAPLGNSPMLAAFADGSLVAVFSDGEEMSARFIDASGAVLSDPVSIGPFDGAAPRIAAGSEGRWIIAANYFSEGPEGLESIAVRFQGTSRLDENPIVLGSGGYDTDIAMLADGSFFGSWIVRTFLDEEEYWFDPSFTRLHGRGFSADGLATSDDGTIAPGQRDEQGLGGHEVVAAGLDRFAAAWIDQHRMDYLSVSALGVGFVDGNGNILENSGTIAEVDENAGGVALSLTDRAAVVAIAEPVPAESSSYDIVLYEAAFSSAGTRRLEISDPREDHEFWHSMATSPDGVGIVMWRRAINVSPTADVVARPFLVTEELPCGDATYDARVTAIDALGVLRAALGARYCAGLVCDANGDGQVSTTDALLTLRMAIGVEVTLGCPAQELIPTPKF